MSTFTLKRIYMILMSCFMLAVVASIFLKYMLLNCKIQSLFYFTPLQDDHIDDILVFTNHCMSSKQSLKIVMTVTTVVTFPPFSRKLP